MTQEMLPNKTYLNKIKAPINKSRSTAIPNDKHFEAFPLKSDFDRH